MQCTQFLHDRRIPDLRASCIGSIDALNNLCIEFGLVIVIVCECRVNLRQRKMWVLR